MGEILTWDVIVFLKEPAGDVGSVLVDMIKGELERSNLLSLGIS